jgi:hypothetical protein
MKNIIATKKTGYEKRPLKKSYQKSHNKSLEDIAKMQYFEGFFDIIVVSKQAVN